MRSLLFSKRLSLLIQFSRPDARIEIHRRFLSLNRSNHNASASCFLGSRFSTAFFQTSGKRYKYKSTAKSGAAIDESDDEVDLCDNSSRLITGHMTSLRVDGVLKAGLGMSRNKVEAAFYESRIRVNGAKVPKKSYKVSVGDEVDIIKEKSPLNETYLSISRVEVVSARENDDSDGLVVKMKRFKSLTVDDYSKDPFNG